MSILFIISIVAALIEIYRHYTKRQSQAINSQELFELADSQAVKYGKTIISKVNRVHDGDTLNVDIKDWPPIVGKSMPVRINKIDTPEITTKNATLKSIAIKARDYVRMQIASGKIIELRNIQRDKYFRLDADLIIDGIDIAQELLKQGLAKPYDGGKKSPWE